MDEAERVINIARIAYLKVVCFLITAEWFSGFEVFLLDYVNAYVIFNLSNFSVSFQVEIYIENLD